MEVSLYWIEWVLIHVSAFYFPLASQWFRHGHSQGSSPNLHKEFFIAFPAGLHFHCLSDVAKLRCYPYYYIELWWAPWLCPFLILDYVWCPSIRICGYDHGSQCVSPKRQQSMYVRDITVCIKIQNSLQEHQLSTQVCCKVNNIIGIMRFFTKPPGAGWTRPRCQKAIHIHEENINVNIFSFLPFTFAFIGPLI